MEETSGKGGYAVERRNGARREGKGGGSIRGEREEQVCSVLISDPHAHRASNSMLCSVQGCCAAFSEKALHLLALLECDCIAA